MLMKETYDTRGRQRNILRLLGFDIEGFVHMAAYRILIFASAIIGIAILGTMIFAPQYINTGYIEVMVLVVWALITPHVYETAKAFALIASRGLSSPDVNQSFVNFAVKNKSALAAYRAFPYGILAVWVLGFIIISAMWLV